MEGSGRRRAALQRRLRHGMRLLLPADPGPAAMLDAVRQVSPGAKRILPHRIQVDGRSQFYLSRAYPIDAEMRRRAGLPQDVTVAYFLKWVADCEADAVRYREQGGRLLAELTARFGGIAGPGRAGPSEAEETGEGVTEGGETGRAGGRRRGVLRVGLLFLCTVVFLGFAVDDGTAGKWSLLAVNALMGLFFAVATVLMAGRRLGRR
jgi:hypothetical protein